MVIRPTSARIEPLEPPPSVRTEGLLGGLVKPVHLMGTLRRNPAFGRPFGALTTYFFEPEHLDPRLRELVILRVGWRTQSVYEFGQHVLAARKVGIGDDEIRLATAPVADGSWTELEAVALQVVDELHDDDCVSDVTWARLAPLVDPPTAIALLALVGFYRMVAGLLNSLGVQREDDTPGWPADWV